MRIDLKANPFYLSDEQIRWVEETLSHLTIEQKVGQLFCCNIVSYEPESIDILFETMEPGAVLFRPGDPQAEFAFAQKLQRQSPVPVLIAGNLEAGGSGIVTGGTQFGSQMAIAAGGDQNGAAALASICAREGKAIGANWAFAPVSDIDMNWRNPITNIRTYGSDPETVANYAASYIKTIQAENVAACMKHFPGDGVDERDQHLVISSNDLSAEEWRSTYGHVYRECIEAGVLSCMVGHILQPALVRELNPGIADSDILPGSLSPELVTGVLRNELGFAGVACTDSTTMAGYCQPMPRSQALPASINAGIDMILFTKNEYEDYHCVLSAVQQGIIPGSRLDETVTRILALKAALGLSGNSDKETAHPASSRFDIIGCAEHLDMALRCAEKSITLVKEQPGVLPITPERYPKVLLYRIEDYGEHRLCVRTDAVDAVIDELRRRGFDITEYKNRFGYAGDPRPVAEILSEYDLFLYIANVSSRQCQTTARIVWQEPMWADCPLFVEEKPTVFVSLENPYHLIDVPRVKTYINTYGSGDAAIQALADKLTGKSAFTGKSVSDVFCGRWDTHL